MPYHNPNGGGEYETVHSNRWGDSVKYAIGYLLFLFGSCAIAQSAWTIGKIDGDEGLYAVVVNESGAIFGQYCYLKEESCVYLMSTDTQCVVNASFPALASGANATTSVSLICLRKYLAYHVTAVSTFDSVDSLVRQGGQFGLAVALKNGTFKVFRFDLDGAVKQIDEMRKRVESIRDSKRPTGTKNQIL